MLRNQRHRQPTDCRHSDPQRIFPLSQKCYFTRLLQEDQRQWTAQLRKGFPVSSCPSQTLPKDASRLFHRCFLQRPETIRAHVGQISTVVVAEQ